MGWGAFFLFVLWNIEIRTLMGGNYLISSILTSKWSVLPARG
jgi:hypothetical protein